MSSDTMPCGCLGHADNESLCQYPKLQAELEALRIKRRDEVVALTKRSNTLVEKLHDIEESYRQVVHGKCAGDEVHCSCVPALRREIDRLNGRIEELETGAVTEESVGTKWGPSVVQALFELQTMLTGAQEQIHRLEGELEKHAPYAKSCPVCGEADFTTVEEERTVTKGSVTAKYIATVDTCLRCTESGDFNAVNDARIDFALRVEAFKRIEQLEKQMRN